ncbi:hypothetical protein AB9F42_36060, partial [Rhizobium leguminosarum]|uniref:hypothetical protein n=1 Tax=Rhizobium leguminosarum TaxID=384 RepID=UPI003F9A8868
ELWLQEFTPIFTAWLTEAIGRSPNVYMGALAGTDSDNDPQVDRIMSMEGDLALSSRKTSSNSCDCRARR